MESGGGQRGPAGCHLEAGWLIYVHGFRYVEISQDMALPEAIAKLKKAAYYSIN